MNVDERAEHLRRLAHARRDATEARAKVALDTLVAQREPVTFRAVAQRAHVSLDFLYRHTHLRSRIEQQRQLGAAAPRSKAAVNDSTIVHALTDQIRRLRDELAETRKQLAAAHGQILYLRRQQPRVKPVDDDEASAKPS